MLKDRTNINNLPNINMTDIILLSSLMKCKTIFENLNNNSKNIILNGTRIYKIIVLIKLIISFILSFILLLYTLNIILLSRIAGGLLRIAGGLLYVVFIHQCSIFRNINIIILFIGIFIVFNPYPCYII